MQAAKQNVPVEDSAAVADVESICSFLLVGAIWKAIRCTGFQTMLLVYHMWLLINLNSPSIQLPVSLLTGWFKVLRPTRHNIGHFRDVLPRQSLGIVRKKLNLTRQKQTTQEQF